MSTQHTTPVSTMKVIRSSGFQTGSSTARSEGGAFEMKTVSGPVIDLAAAYRSSRIAAGHRGSSACGLSLAAYRGQGTSFMRRAA